MMLALKVPNKQFPYRNSSWFIIDMYEDEFCF